MKSDPVEPVRAAPDLAERAAPPTPRLSLAQRAILLLACCGLGLVIGFIGQSLTSQSAWYLAVPICIAVAWLFVADPNECVACDAQRLNPSVSGRSNIYVRAKNTSTDPSTSLH